MDKIQRQDLLKIRKDSQYSIYFKRKYLILGRMDKLSYFIRI